MIRWLQVLPLSALLSTFCIAIPAAADDIDPNSFDRSQFHGKAEVGLGFLALPDANVCTNRLIAIGCTRGDLSPTLELWQLFRPSPFFAAGAGVTIGLFPIADAPLNSSPGVSREHQRGYFTAEGIARFYWLHGPVWESWVGITGGLVVVSDNYITNNNATQSAFIGPRGVTIRTEGYTSGLATGVSRALSDNWSVGAGLRYALWSIPNSPAQDAFGDQASLIGRVATLVIGINVGYRLKL